jgi:plasmid stabilization system protein ParE
VNRYLVIILPSAERDIGAAYEWLAAQNVAAAIHWYDRLQDVIFSLAVFPERCPLAPESRFFQAEIREIFHGRRRHKYRILCTVSESKVQVLHVRHGARLAPGEAEPVD